ncbi:uncharacterized protein BYT42DRAFT_491942 [Radiomyces spectabilis]|uniref:uncharacterized protein n=1 Tax=Radiomyces spectabilis TaxID=64574 RepID=UPI00222126E0|nr:uncharacterized protein BYT42DRAFT_491942 [Radiomyces spectabilis]KAI8388133.1 hypothetical protein BYT42DRAFT_491942 [Radiomyces spectabilis]
MTASLPLSQKQHDADKVNANLALSSTTKLAQSSNRSVLLYHSPSQPHVYRPLPSILVDFFALTLCDLLPTRSARPRTAPELLYFIQKITSQARISCHIAVAALIYIDRCKQNLPKNAIGDQDTAHRIAVASLLVASKFLHGTSWATCWLTNAQMAKICVIYTLDQINQLERSFLNLIKHKCWVDAAEIQAFLLKHRQDLLL